MEVVLSKGEPDRWWVEVDFPLFHFELASFAIFPPPPCSRWASDRQTAKLAASWIKEFRTWQRADLLAAREWCVVIEDIEFVRELMMPERERAIHILTYLLDHHQYAS